MPATKPKVGKSVTPRIPTVLTRNTFTQIAPSQDSPLSSDLCPSSSPALPDFLLEMQSQLRRHEAKFQELDALVSENSRLREALAAAEARIRELEKRSTPPPAAKPPTTVGTEASRHATVTSQASEDAAARTFLPVSESQGFSFIHLPCRSKEPISNMREKLRTLRLQSSRLLGIHYPTNNLMSILVHNDYLEEASNLLRLHQIELVSDFDPTSPSLLPIEIHQNRLVNIALRVPVAQRKISIARSFRKQEWITEEQFLQILQTVRPSSQPPAADSSAMQLDSTDSSLADGSTSAPTN
ncbi:hypothetical protein BD560DRAFT_402663 [Blakeslea trispora]|nr:hypothetical protein BD560DRAFT_402663 [Blakeslea trispora]